MKKILINLIILLLVVVPSHAQLTKGVLKGPLVITSGGTPFVKYLGQSISYTSSGTTNITVNRPVLVSVKAIGGGGGGTYQTVGLDAYGGGGGGGGGRSDGTSVTLVPGVTYQAIVGAAGTSAIAGSATAGASTYFRISASTIYVEVGGGQPGGVFTGSVFPGGAGGTTTTGTNLVTGGAGGNGANGGISFEENGSNGTANGGGGGGAGNGSTLDGNGGSNAYIAGDIGASGIGGFGATGGSPITGNNGAGGGGAGAYEYSPGTPQPGAVIITVSVIY